MLCHAIQAFTLITKDSNLSKNTFLHQNADNQKKLSNNKGKIVNHLFTFLMDFHLLVHTLFRYTGDISLCFLLE